jgi:malonate-semialdehyde dehydrogenase (acetylating)/methylmalonate-semialdehyde dehydrogenase
MPWMNYLLPERASRRFARIGKKGRVHTLLFMSTASAAQPGRRQDGPVPTEINHWIDGNLYRAADRRGEVRDPARGVQTGAVALADEQTVDAAVAAAARALPAWRALPLSRRMPIMQRFRALVAKHSDELAAVIAAEHGKMVDDAAGEVARGLEVIDLACSAPTLLKGEFSDQVAAGVDTYSMRQSVGVCVGITPFNFPAMVPLWMFPIALACGNTFVLKPSERDPSAPMILARLADQAGLPAGVLNVVHGDRVAVDALLTHPDVDAVSFVGSTAVARHIYETAARHGKRVQALGGAKNHMVVLPDADVELAADAVVSAAFGSAGQRCMAISVAVAVGGVADDLVEAIRERAARLRVGPSSAADSEMGPVITPDARDRVAHHVGLAAQAGADVVVDGRGLQVEGHGDGSFVGPCVVDRVTPGMDVYEEEVFGPLLSVVRVDDYDAALELIANSRYGNGAAVFTRSGGAARDFVRRVEAGMVGVNVPIPVPVGFYSFGGWGDSLFGDTHVYGPDGFHFYTRNKVVTSRWPDVADGVRLAFPNG